MTLRVQAKNMMEFSLCSVQINILIKMHSDYIFSENYVFYFQNIHSMNVHNYSLIVAKIFQLRCHINILKIKSIFFAEDVIKTHFYAATTSEYWY